MQDSSRNDDDDVDDDYIDEQPFSLNRDTVFELVDPGTFVGVRSPPNAIELFLFFIVEVLEKGTATD